MKPTTSLRHILQLSCGLTVELFLGEPTGVVAGNGAQMEKKQ